MQWTSDVESNRSDKPSVHDALSNELMHCTLDLVVLEKIKTRVQGKCIIMEFQCTVCSCGAFTLGDASLTFCDYLKVRGVAGIDVGDKEFQGVVRSSLANESDQTERSCGKYSQRYPCYANRNHMCQTQ